MTVLDEHLARLKSLNAGRRRLLDELKTINDRMAKDGAAPSLKERADNLVKGIARLDQELLEANAAASGAVVDGLADGTLGGENGDGANPDPSPLVRPVKAGRLGAPPLSFTDRDVKTLQSAAVGRKAVTVTAAPMASETHYETSVWPFLRDVVRVLDYIPAERTDAPTVTYYRGTTGATAAAAVAEGAAKPESSPVWTSFTAPVTKIAHYSRVNDEVLDDYAGFRNIIGTEMLAGLLAAENEQLLNGSGVAPNMTGLTVTSGIITRAKGTDSVVDALFKATNDLRTGASFTEPDVIILNPVDYAIVRLYKDSQLQYITGDPQDAGPVRLWNTPLLVTNRMTAGTALVANLKEAARVYVRQGPKLDVAPMGGGTAEFIANQTLVRAEERLALAVVRPTAIVKVTGLA